MWFICLYLPVMRHWQYDYAGPLFAKRTDVLPQVSKSRDSRLHFSNRAAEMPVKFQSDTIIITSNLAASRLHEIWR